jgi:hypothetical protein
MFSWLFGRRQPQAAPSAPSPDTPLAAAVQAFERREYVRCTELCSMLMEDNPRSRIFVLPWQLFFISGQRAGIGQVAEALGAKFRTLRETGRVIRAPAACRAEESREGRSPAPARPGLIPSRLAWSSRGYHRVVRRACGPRPRRPGTGRGRRSRPTTGSWRDGDPPADPLARTRKSGHRLSPPRGVHEVLLSCAKPRGISVGLLQGTEPAGTRRNAPLLVQVDRGKFVETDGGIRERHCSWVASEAAAPGRSPKPAGVQ